MKNVFFLILCLFLTISLAYSQKTNSEKLQLVVAKKSDNPLSYHSHTYEIEVSNTSRSAVEFTIETESINCKKNISVLSHKIMSNTSNSQKSHKVPPNEHATFKVELSRNQLTKLDTWHCLNIKATAATGEVISNVLTISQFIPDPRNFN